MKKMFFLFYFVYSTSHIKHTVRGNNYSVILNVEENKQTQNIPSTSFSPTDEIEEIEMNLLSDKIDDSSNAPEQAQTSSQKDADVKDSKNRWNDLKIFIEKNYLIMILIGVFFIFMSVFIAYLSKDKDPSSVIVLLIFGINIIIGSIIAKNRQSN
ncbi:hypothetical protein NGRA_0467 [Nosema granulosis]|uniref:Uncharacterized protein n=1 Tax=Nosema granulosis TaxID=83296 RepID=A0A9P6H0V6_9MICR|nr:hypothetical protein NGRA_0467 [Nosema granulosis]